MLNCEKKILFLRNHKCASSTCQEVLKNFFPIKGGIIGKELPWIHSDINKWKEYIEKNNLVKGKLISVTTVRNPWDRMVSLFYYKGLLSETYGKDGFKNFIKTVKYSFINFIFDKNGNKLIDIVIKIEELDKLFDIMSKMLSVKIIYKNKKINTSSRPDSKEKNYRQYYDDETKKIVSKMFKYEIEYFGYSF